MSSSNSGLEGRLDEVGFADVLHLIRASGQDGTLHLDDGSGAAVVVVVGPGVVHLASTGDDDLRDTVVGGGLVGDEVWDTVVAQSGDGTSGAAVARLIDAGVDPARLRARLYDHTVNTLFELLLPSAARFSFIAGDLHPFAVEPGFPFDDVLDDVRRQVEQWRTIAAAIPSTSMVLLQAPHLPPTSGPITLDHEEFELLGLLDGHRDVAAIIAALGMSAFRVMGTLHRLMEAGIVVAQDPA